MARRMTARQRLKNAEALLRMNLNSREAIRQGVIGFRNNLAGEISDTERSAYIDRYNPDGMFNLTGRQIRESIAQIRELRRIVAMNDEINAVRRKYNGKSGG